MKRLAHLFILSWFVISSPAFSINFFCRYIITKALPLMEGKPEAEFVFAETKAFKIRALKPTDWDDYRTLLNDPKVKNMSKDQLSPLSIDGYFLLRRKMPTSDAWESVQFGIVPKDSKSDQIIGMIQLYSHNQHCPGCAMLGYNLTPAYWGQGIMTEVTAQVVDQSFKELHLNEIHAYAALANEGSNRVLQKVGFKKRAQGKMKRHDQLLEINYYKLKSPYLPEEENLQMVF